MKRILIAGIAFFLLAVIIETAAAQSNLIQAFASTEPAMQVIRLALIGLLMGLFFTSPPRSIYFRIVLGLGSIFLSIGSIALLLEHYMLVLDVIIFVEIAIIFAIDAIELPAAEKNRDTRVSLMNAPRTKRAVTQ